MADPYLQSLFADRIGGPSYGKSTAIYKFEKIKRAKQAARQAHPDIPLIDMGVGEPDEPAFPNVIEVLRHEAGRPDNRGYTDNGVAAFKEAAAGYMHRVFDVTIDPASEVNHCIGGKSALSLLPLCFVNPGDLVLMTAPGYPVFGTHAKYLGGEVRQLPLRPENRFLPDLNAISDDDRRRAKVMVLNYPNNPTGASATLEFFADAVAYARANNIVLIHDAAYAALVFEGQPLSIFRVPGAREVALEVHSLSKSFNMTGWRIGFVCGSALGVRAFADVKDNADSGQFAGIQMAAAHALAHPEYTERIAEKYSRRMDMLVPMLRNHGFDAKKPRGSFFLYVPAPKAAVNKEGARREFASAEEFSQSMITERLISTVPWDDVGAFVRWSVTFVAPSPSEEHRIIADIDRRLGQEKFEF